MSVPVRSVPPYILLQKREERCKVTFPDRSESDDATTTSSCSFDAVR
jgi:hypothetical protein